MEIEFNTKIDHSYKLYVQIYLPPVGHGVQVDHELVGDLVGADGHWRGDQGEKWGQEDQVLALGGSSERDNKFENQCALAWSFLRFDTKRW